MHLFSTPVECPNCGNIVDDPTLEKCPECGMLLTERRTPSRLAGVRRRYGQFRALLAILRVLGVIFLGLGLLIFIFGDDAEPWVRGASLLGGVLLAVALFVVAGIIDVVLDIEENTRAGFRLQQRALDALQREDSPPT